MSNGDYWIKKDGGLPGFDHNWKEKWVNGLPAEIEFWDNWIKSRGSQWPADFIFRIDAYTPLQSYMAGFLPESESVSILDVGSCPLTFLGKQCGSKSITITAVDPLADIYNTLLDRHGVHPPVRTVQAFAERLTDKFDIGTFDLVFSRNAIDHSCSPETAIGEMIKVVKRKGYVILGHVRHEGQNANYSGLHQWDFTCNADGDFIIKPASRERQVNITKDFSSVAHIRCRIGQEKSLSDRDFHLAEILKL